MAEGELEQLNLILQKKYKNIQSKEQRAETLFLDEAKIILVAYGTMARIAKAVVKDLRAKGQKVGLIRPITLWPFPASVISRQLAPRLRSGQAKSPLDCARGKQSRKVFLVLEMSYGQMLEDVLLTVNGKAPVEFLGRSGGGILSEKEIIKKIKSLYG